MRSTTLCRHRIAARDVASMVMSMGGVGLDAGVVVGLVGVNAHRPAGYTPHPALAAGGAGRLPPQLIAAH